MILKFLVDELKIKIKQLRIVIKFNDKISWENRESSVKLKIGLIYDIVYLRQ